MKYEGYYHPYVDIIHIRSKSLERIKYLMEKLMTDNSFDSYTTVVVYEYDDSGRTARNYFYSKKESKWVAGDA